MVSQAPPDRHEPHLQPFPAATLEGEGDVRTSPMTPLSVRATLGWAVAAFVIAQTAGTAAIVLWNALNGRPPFMMAAGYDGPLVALVTLVTNPVLIMLLAAVARRHAGAAPAEYLALKRFSLREFLVGFLAVALLAAGMDGASYLAGHDIVSSFQVDTYTTARAGGWLVPLLLAIVVVGPVGEEILFRGFLFRGWVTSDQYGVFAVIVISQLWAALHVQYDWVGVAQVFLTGLVLGWTRWRSGSTLLTILLHLLVNLESTIETVVQVGWWVP